MSLHSSIRRIVQSHAVRKDSPENEEPPASTLAAQIVDDLTRNEIQPKHQDREKFRRLLREILDTDDDSEETGRVIEINPKINSRLIYVVVRVGLEASFNGDPFENQDDLNKQAVESLAVVELTLQRCPAVLFSVLGQCGIDLQFAGPFYLWLVPRLFIILGRTHDQDLLLGVYKVLKLILMVEEEGNIRQVQQNLVLKYFQGCVKGLWEQEFKSMKSL